MDELRLQLRRLEFPTCAHECLQHVDATLAEKPSKSSGRALRELQKCIDEYLFCSTDRRGVLCPRLNAIQQLQLAQMLCSYWSGKAEMEARLRYPTFDAIFCYREGDTELHAARMCTLMQVASLAIQIGCRPLMADIGQWLLKLGITRNASGLQLCMHLINDLAQPKLYRTFLSPLGFDADHRTLGIPYDSGVSAMDSSGNTVMCEGCPSVAAVLIVANFLELELFALPPNLLMLQVAADWLAASPGQLIRSFKKAGSGSGLLKALSGTIDKMLCVCIDSCLPSSEALSPSTGSASKDGGVFAKLHAALLQFVILASKSLERCEMCVGRHLAECLNRFRKCRDPSPSSEQAQLFLDRLAQTLQVAVASNVFHGSIKDVQAAAQNARVEHVLLEHIFGTVG